MARVIESKRAAKQSYHDHQETDAAEEKKESENIFESVSTVANHPTAKVVMVVAVFILIILGLIVATYNYVKSSVHEEAKKTSESIPASDTPPIPAIHVLQLSSGETTSKHIQDNMRVLYDSAKYPNLLISTIGVDNELVALVGTLLQDANWMVHIFTPQKSAIALARTQFICIDQLNEHHTDLNRAAYGVSYGQKLQSLLQTTRTTAQLKLQESDILVVLPPPGSFVLAQHWDEQLRSTVRPAHVVTWLPTPTTNVGAAQAHANAHLAMVPFDKDQFVIGEESISFALATQREGNMSTIKIMQQATSQGLQNPESTITGVDPDDEEQAILELRAENYLPKGIADTTAIFAEVAADTYREKEGRFPFMQHARVVVPSFSDIVLPPHAQKKPVVIVNSESFACIASPNVLNLVQAALNATNSVHVVMRSADARHNMQVLLLKYGRGNSVLCLKQMAKLYMSSHSDDTSSINNLSDVLQAAVPDEMSAPVSAARMALTSSSTTSQGSEDANAMREEVELLRRRLRLRDQGAGGRATVLDNVGLTMALTLNGVFVDSLTTPQTLCQGRYMWGTDDIGTVVPIPMLEEVAEKVVEAGAMPRPTMNEMREMWLEARAWKR